MLRKSIMLLVATCALVAAVPALASAATGLTEGGKLIPVGSKLDYTSIGHVTITSTKTGNTTCEKGTLTGVVVKNTLLEVEVADVPGTSSFTNCKSPSGSLVTIKNVVFAKERSTGGGTETIALSFTAVGAGGIECKYTTSTASATYNPSETSEGGKEFTLSAQPLSVTPAACGTTAGIDGTFTRETDGTNVHVFLM